MISRSTSAYLGPDSSWGWGACVTITCVHEVGEACVISLIGMGQNRGTLQACLLSVFQTGIFLLQRLIRLLTLWQEFNKIGHREHSEVKKKKGSQPVRLNCPFVPVRALSIKQNPSLFPPTRPLNPKIHNKRKNISAFPLSVWQAHIFLSRNVPSKCDTASLGEQGWNLSTTKAGVGSAQRHRDLGRAKSFISTTAESQLQGQEQAASPNLPLQHRKHNSSTIIE